VEDFFHGAVNGALRNQNIQTDEGVEFYLGRLLADFSRTDDGDCPFEESLAFRLARGFEADEPEKSRIFRRLGDVALYVAGFFSDVLNRSPVDVDYYIDMGEVAYDRVALSFGRFPGRAVAPLYKELAAQFAALVDVLAEVSEHHSLTTSTGTLRLYEKWLRTDSERIARLLTAKGILPSRRPSGGSGGSGGGSGRD
jgi:hypothetical protein